MEVERNDSSGGPPEGRDRASIAFFSIRDVLLSLFIAVVVIVFVYQPVKVEGTSMMPSLVNQERIFVNKFIYRFGLGKIERGDMVVFWYPGDPTKSYIKRVIGVPGDVMEIDNGQVHGEREAPGGGLRAAGVQGPPVHGADDGGAGLLLCPGRSPQLLKRQPHLGPGPAQVHLRQGRICLLAAG